MASLVVVCSSCPGMAPLKWIADVGMLSVVILEVYGLGLQVAGWVKLLAVLEILLAMIRGR